MKCHGKKTSESHLSAENFKFISSICHWVSLWYWTMLHVPGSDGLWISKLDLGILSIVLFLIYKYVETKNHSWVKGNLPMG